MQEYCEGGDLRSALSATEANLAEYVRWDKHGHELFMDVACGLAYLHQKQVCSAAATALASAVLFPQGLANVFAASWALHPARAASCHAQTMLSCLDRLMIWTRMAVLSVSHKESLTI